MISPTALILTFSYKFLFKSSFFIYFNCDLLKSNSARATSLSVTILPSSVVINILPSTNTCFPQKQYHSLWKNVQDRHNAILHVPCSKTVNQLIPKHPSWNTFYSNGDQCSLIFSLHCDYLLKHKGCESKGSDHHIQIHVLISEHNEENNKYYVDILGRRFNQLHFPGFSKYYPRTPHPPPLLLLFCDFLCKGLVVKTGTKVLNCHFIFRVETQNFLCLKAHTVRYCISL